MDSLIPPYMLYNLTYILGNLNMTALLPLVGGTVLLLMRLKDRVTLSLCLPCSETLSVPPGTTQSAQELLSRVNPVLRTSMDFHPHAAILLDPTLAHFLPMT